MSYRDLYSDSVDMVHTLSICVSALFVNPFMDKYACITSVTMIEMKVSVVLDVKHVNHQVAHSMLGQ